MKIEELTQQAPVGAFRMKADRYDKLAKIRKKREQLNKTKMRLQKQQSDLLKIQRN